MVESFYPFFFTHLTQFVNYQQGVQTWIDPMRPVSFFRPESAEQNNVYFLISGFQPEGTITIEVDKGQYLLDTSSSLTIDTALTVDCTVQDISGFSSELKTPITSSSLTREYKLDWLNQHITRSYPETFFAPVLEGVYPFQKVSTQKYTINPVLVEPLEYRKDLTSGDEVLYESLTVDNSLITIDATHIPNDLANGLLTTDRTGFYVQAAPGQAVLDASPNDSEVSRVLVSGVADGNVIVSWKVGDLLTSRIYYPALGRGFLPASNLDLDMKGATLHEIALSILSLISQRDEVLLLSALTELSYIWSSVLNNIKDGQANSEVTPGLPSFLPRMIPSVKPIQLERSTLQQAWIGYAITKAVAYLRSRPIASIIKLPTWLPELLNQLAAVVSSAIDPATGITFQGFDEFGYLIDQADLSAAVVAEMFLQEYLSIKYDAKVHRVTARAHVHLLKNNTVHLEDGTFEHLAPLYKLFWNVIHNRHSDSDVLVSQIHTYTQTTKLNDFQAGLWKFVVSRLPVIYEQLNYESINTPFVQIGTGLYERRKVGGIQDKIPALVASSWSLLLRAEGEIVLNEEGEVQVNAEGGILLTNQTSVSLLPSRTFSLGALDALGFESLVLAEAQRMMPFGYRWASEEASTTGRIGALLKASAELAFGWYLQYRELLLGQYLTQAQGDPLDQWAQLLNYDRPPLQPDSYLKEQLLPLLRNNRTTISNLISLADKYGVRATYIEPVPIKALINSQELSWESLTPEQIDQLDETNEFVVPRDLYPSSVRLEQGNNYLVVWEAVAPSIVIYSQEVSPEFTTEVIDSVPASVPIRIYARLHHENVVQTSASASMRRITG